MKLRKYKILLFSIVLLLCSWHLDSAHNANTISRAAMVASLAEHGTFAIDRYHQLTEDKAHVGDHYYSEKAPLPSLLMVPVWWLGVNSGILTSSADGAISEDLLRLSGFVCGSLPLAMIIFWTWRKLRAIDLPITASWMAVLPIMGSYLLNYSGSFFGHLLAAFFLLLAWDRRKRSQHLVAGSLAAAAVLSEYSLFVFPLIWMVQDIFAKQWRSLRRLMLGGLPGIAILLMMDLIVTGSMIELPYSQVHAHADSQRVLGLATPSIEALFGLFLTPYRGMFIYAPVTILCAIAIFGRIGNMDLKEILLHPLIVPSLMLVLMIASHSMWWGGWAIGPRHLTSITVLMFAAGIPMLRNTSMAAWAFLLLSYIGLVVNFAAKCTIWYSAPTGENDPIFGLIFPAFADREFTVMQLPVQFGMGVMEATFLYFILFSIALFFLARSEMTITTD